MLVLLSIWIFPDILVVKLDTIAFPWTPKAGKEIYVIRGGLVTVLDKVPVGKFTKCSVFKLWLLVSWSIPVFFSLAKYH